MSKNNKGMNFMFNVLRGVESVNKQLSKEQLEVSPQTIVFDNGLGLIKVTVEGVPHGREDDNEGSSIAQRV